MNTYDEDEPNENEISKRLKANKISEYTQDKYEADGNKFAELVTQNIYYPTTTITEIVANFYDEDATNVKVNFDLIKDYNDDEYITGIRIIGNGDGFSFEELKKINILANSSKKKDMFTKKYKRKKLGSFGIALSSFPCLGKVMHVWSREISTDKILHKQITIEKDGMAKFSEIERFDTCELLGQKDACAIVVENCNILTSIFHSNRRVSIDYEYLTKSLSNLPVGDNFKIELQNKEVKRYQISNDFYNITFDSEIFGGLHGDIFYAPSSNIIDFASIGVFLVVDNRIIEWNIYDEIKDLITSPGSVNRRIYGFIIADGLVDEINASRTGITDFNKAEKIAYILKDNIKDIHKKATKFFEEEKKVDGKDDEQDDVKDFKRDLEKKKAERITIVKERMENANNHLERLNIKFCYDPREEIEVVIISSQAEQIGLLKYKTMQITIGDSPDAIILINRVLQFMEYELELSNFLAHEHNHHDVDYIMCWNVDKKEMKKKAKSYLKKFVHYVKTIYYNELKDEVGEGELTFVNEDGTSHIIKVYVLSDIIENYSD